MPRSPEDPKGHDPSIVFPDYKLKENTGQLEGREHMFEELLPVLQQHFGTETEISIDNFQSYYDRYVKTLLSSSPD